MVVVRNRLWPGSLALLVLASACSDGKSEPDSAIKFSTPIATTVVEAAPFGDGSSATFEALCDVTSLMAATWVYETDSISVGNSVATDEKFYLGPGFLATPLHFVSLDVPDFNTLSVEGLGAAATPPPGTMIEGSIIQNTPGMRSDLAPVSDPDALTDLNGQLLLFLGYRSDVVPPALIGEAIVEPDGSISFQGPCADIRTVNFAKIAASMDAKPTLDFLYSWRGDIRSGDYEKYWAAQDSLLVEQDLLAQEQAWLNTPPTKRTLRPGLPASVAPLLDVRGVFVDVTGVPEGGLLEVRSPSGVSGAMGQKVLPVLYPAYFLTGDDRIEVVLTGLDGREELVASFDPAKVDPLGVVVVSGPIGKVVLEMVPSSELMERFGIADPAGSRESLLGDGE